MVKAHLTERCVAFHMFTRDSPVKCFKVSGATVTNAVAVNECSFFIGMSP